MFDSDAPTSLSAAYGEGDLKRLVGEDTKLFPTPLFSTRPFHAAAWLSATLSLLLLLASPARPQLLGAALGLGLGGAALLLMLRQFLLAPRHAAAVAAGAWQLGVYSYSSGDIAVKVPGLLGLLPLRELHIEAASFVRADAARCWCAQGGLPRRGLFLVIHYLAIDASPRRVVVSLRDGAAEAARYLTTRKVGMGYSVA